MKNNIKQLRLAFILKNLLHKVLYYMKKSLFFNKNFFRIYIFFENEKLFNLTYIRKII